MNGVEGMNRQLATIVAQYEDMQARLHQIVEATPAERWSVRADPARWSVAECVAHLNLTSRAFVSLIRAALEEGRRRDAPPQMTYRQDFFGWLIALMSGPLFGVGGFRFGRVKTTAAFVPGGDLDRATIVREFDQLQTEQIGLTRNAAGLPLSDLYITSPFDARVRYNVYSALVILPRHQSRHLDQAEEVWRGR